ncbi:MAG TPA: hypothetical protein VFW96_17215 [Thermomicrobiales bacterium]|nr:hypothetical protein [Thermomicrobiales bacterium]
MQTDDISGRSGCSLFSEIRFRLTVARCQHSRVAGAKMRTTGDRSGGVTTEPARAICSRRDGWCRRALCS